jgi:VWFA-related protein
VRCAVTLLLAASLYGQQSPPGDPALVIRSTTNLVQIHVIAEDAQGRPITNLQRANFQVLDDGKLQPLTFFEIDPAKPSAGASKSTPATQDSPDIADVDASYALILLDWINTNYVDRVRAQDHVIKLLKDFQPRQHTAIYLLSQQPQLLLDFTSDRAALLATAQSLPLGFVDDDTVPTSRFDARSGTAPARRLSAEEQIFAFNTKVNDLLRSFDTMADRLALVPGRKSLLWISAGFPMTIDDKVVPGARPAEIVFFHDIEKTLGKLNRADVAVYAVDPRGLAVTGRGFPDSLVELATRTGGTAFFNRNDLDTGMRLALQDSQTGYTLGFTVPPQESPGFHEIRVRVNRSAIRLRYRESYRLQDPAAAIKPLP